MKLKTGITGKHWYSPHKDRNYLIWINKLIIMLSRCFSMILLFNDSGYTKREGGYKDIDRNLKESLCM